MPPKRTSLYLPLAAFLLAGSVLTVDGEAPQWVKVALLALAGCALVVWAVAFSRERLRRKAAGADADPPPATADPAASTPAPGTALNG